MVIRHNMTPMWYCRNVIKVFSCWRIICCCLELLHWYAILSWLSVYEILLMSICVLLSVWMDNITRTGIIFFMVNIGPWFNSLTHCGLVTPYGGLDLGQHWFRLWLLYRDWSLPSHSHNWTVWNPRCIARYFYANQTVSPLKIQWGVQFVLARA